MIYVDMIVTFLVAALSGLGIGSGGLFVLYLTFLRQYDQLSAQGMNLLFFLFASSAAMTVHLAKRKFRPLVSLLLFVAGVPGVLLGTKTALLLPREIVTRVFGGFLVLAGLLALFSPGQREKNGENPEKT